MTITPPQHSTGVWIAQVALWVIGIVLFFIGFGIPHMAYGEFSDKNQTFCGEIGTGLWEYCTRTCHGEDWECDDWADDPDYLTAARVLLICSGTFAVMGLLVSLMSKILVKSPCIMLCAAVFYILASATGATGIGLFLRNSADDFDEQFGAMYHTDSYPDWAGGLSIASCVIFFLNVGLATVDWRMQHMVAAYENI